MKTGNNVPIFSVPEKRAKIQSVSRRRRMGMNEIGNRKKAAKQPSIVEAGFLVCLMATHTKNANQRTANRNPQLSLARKQTTTAAAEAGRAMAQPSNTRKLN
jgi:hypothetical protein